MFQNGLYFYAIKCQSTAKQLCAKLQKASWAKSWICTDFVYTLLKNG